jgi:lipoprotein Spr
MRRNGAIFGGYFALIALFLVSCHSSRKASSSHTARQPRFINDVSFAPHNKTNVTSDAIDPRKYTPKPHTPSKPIPVSPKATAKVDKVEAPNVVRKKYAEIVGIKPKQIESTELYQFIDKWYGTNYRLGGSDNAGIDCSGFAQKLYNEVYGIDLSRTSREQFANCKRVKKAADAREGDLVFFHIHSKRITHVGVYLANNFFVHSSTTGGVMISNLSEDYWHKYYAGIGRVPKG